MVPADSFDDFVESLRGVFFALRAVSAEMLADLDCSAIERGILKDLEEQGPQTVPALAHARAVSRQAMQKAVDRLAGRGLLAVEPNPRHQRSSLIALAPAGKKLFTEIRARERRILARVELPISDAELRRTTRALRELGELFASPDFARSRGPQGGRG
jgi:DNA-binding MarR family transcriptional regulator